VARPVLGSGGGGNGHNRYRLAVFPPSSVTAAGLSSWTYWDITTAMLPAAEGYEFLDFPDLAYGSTYLYLSANYAKAGKVYKSLIARIGLDNLQLGLNLAAGAHAWRYIEGPLFFGRVAQQTRSRALWAQNTSTSSIGASYWDESSTSWFGPFNIPVFSWPNTDYNTVGPDGKQWLNTYGGRILAATRAGQNGADLWVAWTAGRGSGQLAWLKQPHIELVRINASTLTFVSQRAIWNPGYAFGYPNLNANIGGELGIALAWGGAGTLWANFAVGDLTVSPNLVWNMTGSTTFCGCGRWGDYLAIRPRGGDSKGFSAAGYGTVTSETGGGYRYDPHWVDFTVNP
jgi:hypothetical protein